MHVCRLVCLDAKSGLLAPCQVDIFCDLVSRHRVFCRFNHRAACYRVANKLASAYIAHGADPGQYSGDIAIDTQWLAGCPILDC